MIDTGFANLFRQLMKNHFMTPGKPVFGAKPTEVKIKGLVAGGAAYLKRIVFFFKPRKEVLSSLSGSLADQSLAAKLAKPHLRPILGRTVVGLGEIATAFAL